ncbi:MAG: hypothetical protein R3B13_15560 [Polyangiaceae bacterium]
MASPFALVASAALVLVLASCSDGGSSSGGSTADGGGGTGGGGGGTCRFEQPACAGCLASSCAAETTDCYGSGWKPSDLCGPTGAAAGCTTATSSSDALAKQTAYSKCALASCTSACK